jgi:uncharacterized protein YbaR (Trm112 family)/SAM-dependent methyltransferase
MKSELVDLICCPACQQALTLNAEEQKESEVWRGNLICASCQTAYAIQDGMPRLYVNDEKWAPKSVEAEGWVTFHKQLSNYAVQENAIDLKIPYYPEEPWTRVAKSFDIALDNLNLTGAETILDLGAGRGWAAKQFAMRGCRVVALDVTPDENVGLGRARALMDDAQVYFDRIIADGENLPFFPDTFDVVFCAAALHHSSHLSLLMQNISQALKPGGRLCAINEPCRTIIDDEQDILARDATSELEIGIIETRPNWLEYKDALQQAGLNVKAVFPPLAREMDEPDLRAWARALGVIHPYWRQRPVKHQLGEWKRFFRRRLKAISQGNYGLSREWLFSDKRQQMETAILLWAGGEFFLMAEKQI